MDIHFSTVDLETLAELNIGAVDDFLYLNFTRNQRQPPEIAAIEVKQIKCQQRDPSTFALQLVLENAEIGGAVIGGGNTSPSMIAEPALMCHASSAIFRKRLVQS